jgi:hypothetical protein
MSKWTAGRKHLSNWKQLVCSKKAPNHQFILIGYMKTPVVSVQGNINNSFDVL